MPHAAAANTQSKGTAARLHCELHTHQQALSSVINSPCEFELFSSTGPPVSPMVGKHADWKGADDTPH